MLTLARLAISIPLVLTAWALLAVGVAMAMLAMAIVLPFAYLAERRRVV